MIAIVDYGVGNLSSVQNMFRKIGVRAVVTNDINQIASAEKIVLPGVGHFDYAMRKLNSSGLRDALDNFALNLQRPVLGICLGAQLLGNGSEEGTLPGLGWIEMECERLPVGPGIKVPHMGWGEVTLTREDPLFTYASLDARYYFVHSYYMKCKNPSSVVATADHGVTFACVVNDRRIYGTQFHPEKSLRHGASIFRAFACGISE